MKDVFVYLKIFNETGPTERWKIQDNLDKILKERHIGKITGGGTLINTITKKIQYCGIDIELKDVKHIDELIAIVKDLKIESKYTIEYNDKELKFN